ncbi:hypothetical protein CFIMG_004617RA [Ceratocystis fimbriata CBS 114723]|uniref:Uncharacterized protein n=1 Tax=Ceratocystis fimbriata CBS 114723 TaxID=1035309 RepID=A0A2C5WYP8_9PEZI|nr:hypothetical protein CFIMG_004617RA [Ceratocystis fimbriata CBS 114723]
MSTLEPHFGGSDLLKRATQALMMSKRGLEVCMDHGRLSTANFEELALDSGPD